MDAKEGGYSRFIGLNDAQMNVLYQCRTRPHKHFNMPHRIDVPRVSDPKSLVHMFRRFIQASPVLTSRLDLSQDEPRFELGVGPEISFAEQDPDEF